MYKFKNVPKNQNFDKNLIPDTHFLKLLGKMYRYELDPASIVERYRGDTIPSTDGRTDKVKPVSPFNFVEAGVYNDGSFYYMLILHDDVIKGKHFLRYWPFVRGIHRSPENFPHEG